MLIMFDHKNKQKLRLAEIFSSTFTTFFTVKSTRKLLHVYLASLKDDISLAESTCKAPLEPS